MKCKTGNYQCEQCKEICVLGYQFCKAVKNVPSEMEQKKRTKAAVEFLHMGGDKKKKKKRPVNKPCAWKEGCRKKRAGQSSYCAEHAAIMTRSWYYKNREVEAEKRRQYYQAIRSRGSA